MPKPQTWKEKQEAARRAQLEQEQQARAGAAGRFIEVDLERLRTIGGAGLLRPLAERQAPAHTTVQGQPREVKDVEIEQGSPEFWIRYLFDEMVSTESKALLAKSPDRARLLAFYNRIFERPDDFEAAARPYVVRRAGTILELYHGEMDALRAQLRAAMDVGFEWMQWPADRASQPTASSATSVSYMMEVQEKTVHTPLVWRTEDRRTLAELRTTGFTRQVTVEARITALGMDQPWNPYSTDEVRNRMWYRRQNTDNCLYTGISVALNPFASLVFPKITLSPTTLAPVANAAQKALQAGGTVETALLAPNGEPKPEFAPYVARVQLADGSFRLCLYSRARAILMALDGKYLNTQGMQGRGQRDLSQSFPEYGSLGVTGENVFAQVELHRFFHEWSDDQGFTAFVNRAGCTMVERSAVLACFGENQAQTGFYATVLSAYEEIANGGPFGLRWAAGGAGHEKVTPRFQNITAAWVEGRRITLR